MEGVVFGEMLADQLEELLAYVGFHRLIVGGIVPDDSSLLFHQIYIQKIK